VLLNDWLQIFLFVKIHIKTNFDLKREYLPHSVSVLFVFVFVFACRNACTWIHWLILAAFCCFYRIKFSSGFQEVIYSRSSIYLQGYCVVQCCEYPRKCTGNRMASAKPTIISALTMHYYSSTIMITSCQRLKYLKYLITYSNHSWLKNELITKKKLSDYCLLQILQMCSLHTLYSSLSEVNTNKMKYTLWAKIRVKVYSQNGTWRFSGNSETKRSTLKLHVIINLSCTISARFWNVNWNFVSRWCCIKYLQ